MQAIPHPLLQEGELGLAGAVAGVVSGRIGQQPSRRGTEGVPIHCRVQLHEVESAHQHIRPEPVHDVQNPLVGASADADGLSILPDQQVLLMPEIVRPGYAILPDIQAEGIHRDDFGAVIAGEEGEPFAQFHLVLHEDQSDSRREGARPMYFSGPL